MKGQIHGAGTGVSAAHKRFLDIARGIGKEMFFMAEGGDGGGGGAVGAVGAVGSGGGGTATAAASASSTSSSSNVSGGEKSSTSDVSNSKDSVDISPEGKEAAKADSAKDGGNYPAVGSGLHGGFIQSAFGANAGLNVGTGGNISVNISGLSPTASDLANLTAHSNFNGITVTFAQVLDARHDGAPGFSSQFLESLKSAESQASIAQHGGNEGGDYRWRGL